MNQNMASAAAAIGLVAVQPVTRRCSAIAKRPVTFSAHETA
jgi:hypothetical protein